MTSKTFVWFGWLVLWVILSALVFLFAVGGCAPKVSPPQMELDRLTYQTGGLNADLEGIGWIFDHLKKGWNKSLVVYGQDATIRASARVDALNVSIERTRKERNDLLANLDKQVARYDSLKASWSYKIGHAIVVGFWIILGSYVVLGILGTVLTMSGAGGVGFGIGKFILNLLPAANLFSFASRTIEKKRSSK